MPMMSGFKLLTTAVNVVLREKCQLAAAWAEEVECNVFKSLWCSYNTDETGSVDLTCDPLLI